MRSLYKRHTNPSDFVPEELFKGIAETLNTAITDDFIEEYPTLTETLRNNNEVFAAFKVHDQCERMAGRLTDENGELKTFEQWRREAEPIASHHNKVWLRTEYDTAIKRAAQARKWKQFESERDVLPNLRWVPSTAAHPGADHTIFWDVVRPIDDPFWSQHRPGDRWGCQCSLEATDDPETVLPAGASMEKPAPGLDGNPAVTGKIFSESHPYFPKNCSSCPFNTGDAPSSPKNAARDCNQCRFFSSCVPTSLHPSFRTVKVSDGKDIKVSTFISENDVDFTKLMDIARHFAKESKEVMLTPKMTRPSKFDYDCVYESLRGTKYEGKCPDLCIDGVWYEHEGFTGRNPKLSFRNMLNHGLKQAANLIIDRPDLTEAYMKRVIRQRIADGQAINEIWLKDDNGLIRLI